MANLRPTSASSPAIRPAVRPTQPPQPSRPTQPSQPAHGGAGANPPAAGPTPEPNGRPAGQPASSRPAGGAQQPAGAQPAASGQTPAGARPATGGQAPASTQPAAGGQAPASTQPAAGGQAPTATERLRNAAEGVGAAADLVEQGARAVENLRELGKALNGGGNPVEGTPPTGGEGPQPAADQLSLGSPTQASDRVAAAIQGAGAAAPVSNASLAAAMARFQAA